MTENTENSFVGVLLEILDEIDDFIKNDPQEEVEPEKPKPEAFDAFWGELLSDDFLSSLEDVEELNNDGYSPPRFDIKTVSRDYGQSYDAYITDRNTAVIYSITGLPSLQIAEDTARHKCRCILDQPFTGTVHEFSYEPPFKASSPLGAW